VCFRVRIEERGIRGDRDLEPRRAFSGVHGEAEHGKLRLTTFRVGLIVLSTLDLLAGFLVQP
jgi:hypothetical protein